MEITKCFSKELTASAVVTIEDGGHLMMQEQATKVAGAINAWLATAVTGQASYDS